MKRLIVVAIGILLTSMTTMWQSDFTKARERAQEEHKYILLNFSGSDWCVPCIRTRKEIFDKEQFSRFADSNLILVNADFPRLKKDELSKAQTKANETLAEQYDKEGVFPMTLLIDPSGKVLKQWRGYPNTSPQGFVDQIKSFGKCN